MATLRERAPWLEKILDGAQNLIRSDGPSAAAGLIGALASVIVMGIFRFAWGTTSLPELVGERILPLLPVDLFIKLLVTFAPHPKTGPLALSLLGQIVLGALLGPLYHRIAKGPDEAPSPWPSRRDLIVAGSFVVAMELLSLILFWPVLGESLVGDPIGRARFITSVANLFIFIAFMGVLALADTWLRYDWLAHHASLAPEGATASADEPSAATDEADAPSGNDAPTDDAEPATMTATDDPIQNAAPESEANALFPPAILTRRQIIGKSGATVLALAGGVIATEALIGAWFARSNLAYEGMITPPQFRAPITPIEDFYVVSKNALDPVVIADQWQLELRGLVKHEHTWNYKALWQLPSETRAITLECISNGVGERLMSTAEWTGIQLGALLDLQGGATKQGKYVIFTCADGFTASLPLADLVEARSLLTWQMNGQTLPPKHGFPLRVIVPGRYGEQSAKWLTRIDIVDQPFKGFYQSQGWSADQLATTSRIDLPSGKAPLGPVSVLGIAFAGIRGVQKVEVSADAGATWNTATLMPPLSDQTWVYWQWNWQPATKGTYTLLVRATDKTGALQIQKQRGVVPAGATGWEKVKVQVG